VKAGSVRPAEVEAFGRFGDAINLAVLYRSRNSVLAQALVKSLQNDRRFGDRNHPRGTVCRNKISRAEAFKRSPQEYRKTYDRLNSVPKWKKNSRVKER
jgi:hypothetical protein